MGLHQCLVGASLARVAPICALALGAILVIQSKQCRPQVAWKWEGVNLGLYLMGGPSLPAALMQRWMGAPQMEGLNSECDGKVWRVDVGMSSGVLNAEAQVLPPSSPCNCVASAAESSRAVCEALTTLAIWSPSHVALAAER